MKNPLIFLFFLFTSNILFSQITNTRKWRKTEKDSLDNALVLYDEKKYLMALPVFENIYNAHPKEEFIKYMYAKSSLYRADKYMNAYNLLTEVYAKNKKVYKIQYDMAQAAHFNYKLDEAEQFIANYIGSKKLSPDDLNEGKLLQRYITNAKKYYNQPTKAIIKNVGPAVNTNDDEYVPAISADESILIFTYKGPKSKGGRMNDFLQPDPSGEFTEDVYLSYKANDNFDTPVALDSINTNAHDAAISLSPDGQVLYIYRDNGDDHGDIYQSFMIGETFSRPVKLRGGINSYSWDGHCSLSPDGQMLYFSSERPGGLGGRDIYRATFLPDSTWGNIVNLGDSVNTALDDDSPFIHPDGVTLYFSSKGRTSMGGYDIFKSTMSLADTTFKKTEHLGYPINSTGDDIYFVLAANGKTGYYSSGKSGGNGLKDIYQIETNFENAKPVLYLVKGKVTFDKKPVLADIKIEITTKNNRIYKTLKTNATAGNYLVSLPPGSAYKITYTFDKDNFKTFDIDATKLNAYKEQEVNINFESKQDPLKDTAAIASASLIVIPPIVIDTKTTTVANNKFVPKTKLQQKAKKYAEKYGDISAEGLEFRVQIAAYKFPKNYIYAHLKKCGKVENLLLDDGITRITIGGKFNTIRSAFEHNIKVVNAGQADAFVTALYQGKRIYLEELEKMGIFVVK
jgi:hypothetical protein